MAEETTVDKTDHDTTATDRGADHDGQRESLRANIEAAWKEHGGDLPENYDDQDRPRSAREREERNRRAEPRGRAARAAKDAASADATSTASRADYPDAAAQPAVLGRSSDAPPTAWAREAKEHFASLPPAVEASRGEARKRHRARRRAT